jgi:small-conductance mechanosensitive channel
MQISKWYSRLRKWDELLLEQWLRWSLAVAAVLLLVVAVRFGFMGDFAGVTASAAAAVFCLIFVFLPKSSGSRLLSRRLG